MIEQEIRDLLATCIRELRKDYKKMTSNDIYYDMVPYGDKAWA